MQIAGWTQRARAWRAAIAAYAAAAGIALAPLTLPVLPVDRFIAYEKALHVEPSTAEHLRLAQLPQYWADMFGWPEMAAAVARAYATLTPQERARAYILAGNYGEASAVAFFGPSLGLPPPISGHNAYFTWGYGSNPSADIMIDMGATVAGDRAFCHRPTLAATFRNAYVMPYENDMGIVVCRGMHQPLSAIFPRQRSYN